MPQNVTGRITMVLADAATPGLRFKLKSDLEFELATENEPGDAVAQNTGIVGQEIAGQQITPSVTIKMVASEAIGEGIEVFAAAAGKIQLLPVAAGTYFRLGKSLEAASADNSIIEILPEGITEPVIVV